MAPIGFSYGVRSISDLREIKRTAELFVNTDCDFKGSHQSDRASFFIESYDTPTARRDLEIEECTGVLLMNLESANVPRRLLTSGLGPY
jgi:hypothetical protein